MNKLQSGQMTILLCLSAAFSMMCAAFPFTLEQLIGTAISIGIQILLCIPVLYLARHNDSITAHCIGHKFVPLLFFHNFIFNGGRSLAQIWNVTSTLSLPFSNHILFAVIWITLVCLYTSTLGLRTLARSSTLIFGVLLLTLFVMLLGGNSWMQLQSISFSPDASIWKSTLHHLTQADELPLLVILIGFLKEHPVKNTLRFFGISLLLWSFVLFLGMTILGQCLSDAPYPFFMLGNISQPFQTQRADALYLVLFVLLCVARLTLLTTLSAHLLGEAFSGLRWRNQLSLVAMIGYAIVIHFFGVADSWLCLIPILFLGTGIPLYFLYQHNRKAKGVHPA